MRMPEIHNDNKLFEILTLESVSSGLSRKMIQNKKADYRKAFSNFSINKVAKYTQKDIEKLLKPMSTIVKNRRKVESTVNNAKKIIEIKKEFKTFDKYIHSFVKKPINHLSIEAKISRENLLHDMKARGFTFIGPTALHVFLIIIGAHSYTQKQRKEYENRRKNRVRTRKKKMIPPKKPINPEDEILVRFGIKVD